MNKPIELRSVGAVVIQQKSSGLIGQAERYPLSGREAGQCSAGKTVKRGGTVMRGGAKKESKRSAGKHAVQRRKCIAGKYAGNAVHLHLSKPRAAHHAQAIMKSMPTGRR